SPGWQTQPLKKSHQSILLEIPLALRVVADLESLQEKSWVCGEQSCDRPDEQASTSYLSARCRAIRNPSTLAPDSHVVAIRRLKQSTDA
ncbi:MAG: hypothetical protein ACXVCO_08560, partial [Ktedonobacterales bacterium]